MSLIEKVKKTIDSNKMLLNVETLLVGLSGGPDSVCLIHVLLKLYGKLKVHAVYIDHGLRPYETSNEIEFCKKLCENLKVNFIVKRIDIEAYSKEFSGGIQAIAREARYRMLEEVALKIKASRIALGHNKNDRAETVLLNLIRGAGPSGLSGIPGIRGKVIRPLIDVTRSEIDKYLNNNSIESIQDSSNLKEKYKRNRVRISLLPRLKEFNPDITDTLITMADIMREENRLIDSIVSEKIIKLICHKTDNRIELFLHPLQKMEKVVVRRVLRKAIGLIDSLRGISFVHIESIIDLINDSGPGSTISLPRNIRLIRNYSTLVVTNEKPKRIKRQNLSVPGETIINECGLLLKATFIDRPEKNNKKNQVSLDAEKITLPLIIRKRLPGDFFYPLGFGKRKKLQDYFVNEKIPRDDRDGIPIVISNNDIVWIAGHRADERFKITEKTKKFLKLELINPT